jgi:hypothetical protein
VSNSLFSTLGPPCVQIIFDTPCLFCNNDLEREGATHMELYFVQWMDGTMLSSRIEV